MQRVKLEPWVIELLRDPISKGPLAIGECLTADYGRIYPVHRGVFDLRALTVNTGLVPGTWRVGQSACERRERFSGSSSDYVKEREGVAEIYQEIPVTGRCLDVGGWDGRLRAFLTADQQYLNIDPILDGVLDRPSTPALRQGYPFLDEPMNFICGLAEHLPLAQSTFDTVHMRSVMDHLLNAELAVREAHRVLRRGGQLIVGLYVVGGRAGQISLRSKVKELVRSVLVTGGFERYRDYHMWHPTYRELCDLLTNCGLEIEKTHWQRSEDGRVCYVLARKPTS